MHIDFFRLYTVNELPGSELEFPWRNILFPDGPCESVISHAIAALGCMHRAQSKALLAISPGVTRYAEPYELYNKAVVALRRYIDRVSDVGLAVASETTLIAILLLLCFEVLCGNNHSATKHLMAAFAILPKTQDEHSPQARGTLVLGSSNAPRTDAVVQIFLRLSSDWLITGPSHYSDWESPLQAICKDPMPSHFQSVRDASVHLDIICSDASRHEEFLLDKAESVQNLQDGKRSDVTSHKCARDCLVMVTSRTLELDNQCTFQLAVRATIAGLT
jgi:hypothetical protein